MVGVFMFLHIHLLSKGVCSRFYKAGLGVGGRGGGQLLVQRWSGWSGEDWGEGTLLQKDTNGANAVC